MVVAGHPLVLGVLANQAGALEVLANRVGGLEGFPLDRLVLLGRLAVQVLPVLPGSLLDLQVTLAEVRLRRRSLDEPLVVQDGSLGALLVVLPVFVLLLRVRGRNGAEDPSPVVPEGDYHLLDWSPLIGVESILVVGLLQMLCLDYPASSG